MMKISHALAALGFAVFSTAPAVAQQAAAPVATQAAPVSTSAAAPPEKNYILGPEDVVEVVALGRTDFSAKSKISTDGTIQLPYLGTVPASNRSTLQLRDEITRALQSGGYFSKPIVQVEVASYASRYVIVLGSVATPGLISMDRPYRISEILARVGGVRDGGADYLIVRSPNGPEKTIHITDFATGSEEADPYVQPGDKIFNPRADIFYVKGQVKAPGEYPIVSNMTLVMALARGGGITDLGSDSHIKIVRKNVEITPKDLNIKVEPYDVIDVGEGWF